MSSIRIIIIINISLETILLRRRYVHTVFDKPANNALSRFGLYIHICFFEFKVLKMHKTEQAFYFCYGRI